MLNEIDFRKKFEEMNKKILNIKDIDCGILGGVHEKYWLKCEKKDYLFKFNQNEKDYSDFGEVFTSYICFILGVKCVESVFAKDCFADDFNKKSGVLVESYRTKNVVESFSLSSLIEKYKRRTTNGYTVREIVKLTKEFCKDNLILLDDKLEQELKEMALLDYLLIQNDRHAKNIEFLIEKNQSIKHLKLAPMFDNGFCLYLQNSKQTNLKCLKKFLSKQYLEVGLTVENPKPKFYIEKTETKSDTGDCIVRDLASELIINKKLMFIFEKFSKLDIKEELDFICSMRETPIPLENRDLIIYGVNNRIKLLELEILKQKMNENNYEV